MSARADRTTRRAGRFLADQQGVSAIEFSLFAAIFLPILLIATDIGFAMHQRMIMDGVLRIGAQEGLRFGPEDALDHRATGIAAALQAAADANATNRMENLAVTVAGPFCYCPQSPDSEAQCTESCAEGAPRPFFRLGAEMPYRSLFLGELSGVELTQLRTRLRVDIYSQVAP
ncbi:MAG: pilus assembly protein [Pararhodobacter sp.]|nr:pilus assembly protein [Pararhodobacter sp.]